MAEDEMTIDERRKYLRKMLPFGVFAPPLREGASHLCTWRRTGLGEAGCQARWST